MLIANKDTTIRIGDNLLPFKKGNKALARIKGKTLIFEVPINDSHYWIFEPKDWDVID